MTDSHPGDPRPDDDDLVSAVLDDEASADERAQVEGDPSLQARLAQFRALSDALAGSTGARPQDLDRVRAAALAAAADTVVAPGAGDAGVAAPPVQLATRRRRPRRIELPSPALAAAVLLVLALVGIGLVIRGGSSDDATNTAASTLDAGGRAEQDQTARDQAGEGGTPDGSSAGEQPAAAEESQAGSLGRFDTQAEMTRALGTLDGTTLRSKAAESSATTGPVAGSGPVSTTTANPGPSEPSAESPPGADAIERCDEVVRAVPGLQLGARSAVASAVLDDRPVLVYSHPRLDAASAGADVVLVSVVDVESCRILFAVQP